MRRRISELAFLLAVGIAACSLASADGSVRLTGHVPKQVQSATKLDRVSATEQVSLSLVMKLDDALLKQTLDALYGPHAPKKKQFLSSSEFTRRFGLEAKRKALKDFAQANGLTVDPSEDRPESMIVKVSGPAGAVEKMFSIQLNHYRAADGQVFRGHDTDPMIPAALAPYLNAVLGLSNQTGLLHPHLRMSSAPVQRGTKNASPGISQSSISGGTGPGGTLAPGDIKTIYGLSTVPLTGSGQTAALFELDGYNPADITAYESQFSLPRPALTFVSVDGTLNLCGGQNCATQTLNGDPSMAEPALDIELIVALAPGVSSINVYDGPNTSQGVLDTYNRIATDNTAQVISTSWGLSENETSQASLNSENTIFQRMAAQGQTIYSASGDNGAYDDPNNPHLLVVDDPASQPYVTGAGGISLSGTLQAPVETTWNNSDGASGGGVSIIWPIPSYQQGVPGMASQQARNVPDVALNADPNSAYAVYVARDWYGIGGTSAAAPLWAALTALIDQERVGTGNGAVGFANPALYQLATGSAYGSFYTDITTGNNLYYSAGPGYDDATGWGSFKGAAMVDLGDHATFISQSVPASMLPGQQVPVVITMKNSGSTTWTQALNYKLGSQNPQDNTTWGLSRALLDSGDSIAPGQQKVFSFTVTAPTTPGNYNFQWGMLQERVLWFQDFTPNVVVTVTSLNPVPSLTGLNPTSVLAGGPAFTLQVAGTNFINGSVVQWNGAALATTFVSGIELTATVPASNIASSGTATITVFNPAPGGGPSGGLTFTINPPDLSLPLPILNFPSDVPINGTLAVSYPPGYDDLSFVWGIVAAPVQGLGSNQLSGRLIDRAGSAQFTTSSPKANLGPYGLVPGYYQISVYASNGSQNSPTAQAFVTLVAGDLQAVRVFPNPWRSDQHAGHPITFDGLSIGTTIKLFTVSGHYIKTLPPATGSVTWEPTNESGDKVASGIYWYLATDNAGNKSHGEVAVVH